jgi:hypothetical protein
VEKVLRSIEFSSYQIDSYCKTLRTTTLWENYVRLLSF